MRRIAVSIFVKSLSIVGLYIYCVPPYITFKDVIHFWSFPDEINVASEQCFQFHLNTDKRKQPCCRSFVAYIHIATLMLFTTGNGTENTYSFESVFSFGFRLVSLQDANYLTC